MAALLKPALFAVASRPEHFPVLKGGRCQCGYLFFPMQAYGCEQCGRHGRALAPFDLAGRGTLLTEAVVHLHADKDRPAPFTVVKIKLDDGPIVLSLLSRDSAPVAPGTKMVTALEEVGRTAEGEPIVDLRFAAAV
jgi:uncharacterized OB-fold protein